jgi:hypothetical protein
MFRQSAQNPPETNDVKERGLALTDQAGFA